MPHWKNIICVCLHLLRGRSNGGIGLWVWMDGRTARLTEAIMQVDLLFCSFCSWHSNCMYSSLAQKLFWLVRFILTSRCSLKRVEGILYRKEKSTKKKIAASFPAYFPSCLFISLYDANTLCVSAISTGEMPLSPPFLLSSFLFPTSLSFSLSILNPPVLLAKGKQPHRHFCSKRARDERKWRVKQPERGTPRLRN